MYEYYFTFHSVTQAQAALRALDRDSIPSRMMRTPKAMQNQGCGHTISVRSGYYIQAKDRLEGSGILFHRVFCKLPDGSFEEVTV